jgi:DNA-binding response OmpR family regulator
MVDGVHVRGSVLIVDDEPTVGEVLSRYLEREGYEARVAGTVLAPWRPWASARPTWSSST